MPKYIVAFLLIVLAACGASQSAFKPLESDLAKINTGDTKVSYEDLRKGYKLYVSNCGGCHWLPQPDKKSKAEWDVKLPEMFLKTELNSDQQFLIRQYVNSKLP